MLIIFTEKVAINMRTMGRETIPGIVKIGSVSTSKKAKALTRGIGWNLALISVTVAVCVRSDKLCASNARGA